MPVGTILPFIGSLSDIPSGWYLCDGTNGTPDLRDRFLQSYGTMPAMQTVEPGLPNIRGDFSGTYFGQKGASSTFGTGSFFIERLNGEYGPNYATNIRSVVMSFSAALSSGIYKDDCNTVQPPAYTVYYIIKVS